MRAVGVATLNANSVKKQRINAKSEPSKCSGLAISRRRQIYARIGVELRPFPVGHAFGTTLALRTSGHLSCRDTFARPKGVRSWQVICLHFIDTRSVVCEFECFLFYKSVYITVLMLLK